MANAYTETRIRDNSHAVNYFEKLNSLWQSEQLCDLTLKVAETEFKVHKFILVSCSTYFKDMFMFTQENDKKCVELQQVDPDAFRVILEYFYTGYVVISESTAERLLATADFFTLAAFKSICGEYLCHNIDIENCITRYCMGDKFGLNELEYQTKSFIFDKLDEVSKTQHFQEIDQETLWELLGTPEPDANGDQIYTAVMDWVKYDLDSRKLFLSDLVKLFPIENISDDFYLNNIKNDAILRQDLKCANWLLDNVDKFDKLNVGTNCFETKFFLTSLLSHKSQCFQLQLKSNKLKPLPARPDIAYFSAISYKKSIYLTAGAYDCTDLEKSYKYDIDENSWSEINLNFERHNAGACILDDKLFVFGGYNCQTNCCLNSCISYDFNSDQKVILPDMKEEGYLPGISVYKNSVYVCCGRSEQTYLSCIERYDPREGIWQNVGKYKFVRGSCSSAEMSESLYASTLCDAIIERFDLRNNSLEELPKPIAKSFN